MCVWGGDGGRGGGGVVYKWKSEDNFGDLVLSFPDVDPGDQTQIIIRVGASAEFLPTKPSLWL